MTQLLNNADPRFRCSYGSREVVEPLAGTASTGIDVWFLLEYTAPWGAKAADKAELPPGVREQMSNVPRSKLLLIRHSARRKETGLAFFVAIVREGEERLYHFTLRSLEALTALDIPAIVRGEAEFAESRQAEPIFLVCTNGRRDLCCARFGPPMYRQLVRHAREKGYPREMVWQSTHLGGHRFAPSMATFPHGTYYGRLPVDALPAYVESQRRGEIYLPNYRGRTLYSREAQIAECYLRQETGITTIGAFRLLEPPQQNANNRWSVRFTSLATEETHLIHMQQEADVYAFLSCSADTQQAISQFSLLEHQIQPPPT